MSYLIRKQRLAAITATALVTMSFFNRFVVTAFNVHRQMPLQTRRQAFQTSLASFGSKSRRGQMSMWGEGPNEKQSIPPPRGDSDRRQGRSRPGPALDGDGRRVRRTRGESGGENSYDEWGNDISSPTRVSRRQSSDDDWGGTPTPSRSTRRQSFDDDWGGAPSTSASKSDGWDDFDEPAPRRSSNRGRSDRGGRGRGGRGGRGGLGRGRGGRGRGRGREGDNFQRQTQEQKKEAAELKTNLKALEGAGFVHLYGLAPVINALNANRRDFENPASTIDLDMLDGEDLDHEMRQRDRKPEAQFSPWLFVQDNMKFGSGGKTGDKAVTAKEVEQLAMDNDISVAYVDKGVLNSLCGSRPHQGYILRCGNLEFTPMSRIPNPKEDENAPSLWLVLDEVVDPQNFGALLRSAYFLGGSAPSGDSTGSSIGMMVCSKNSAPPSPVVSAASAGALELCEVFSTSNLPRTLNAAKEDGWRILGAAASAPNGMIDAETGEAVQCLDLQDVETGVSQPPTILVLGSEGHGLRTLVAKACSGFVRVPGSEAASVGEDTNAGVDSLNVSVTGGIMLWHFLNGRN